MTFKSVLRYSPPERLLRVFRVIWECGEPGLGGYSAKFSVGVKPSLFGFSSEFGGWCLTLLGVRLHYARAYGGRFV